jgi:hypothetical protein
VDQVEDLENFGAGSVLEFRNLVRSDVRLRQMACSTIGNSATLVSFKQSQWTSLFLRLCLNMLLFDMLPFDCIANLLTPFIRHNVTPHKNPCALSCHVFWSLKL